MKGCGYLDEKKRGHGLADFISGLCVLGALILLLSVCSHCYPSVHQQVQELLGGMENGSVRQAFDVLADGLERGEPVREALAETADILFHEKS